MRWFVLILALALCSAPLLACLNDRDTRRQQRESAPDDPMQGLPEIPQVLRGKFDRYPQIYYEMRRDRVAEELKQDPDQLALYDDIAVALDRLGNDDLAIDYMEQKLEQLQTAPGRDADADGHAHWKEHWYSYHANLGTFYAHRWIHNGADPTDMSDIIKGHELIAKAIEIKPDAHFGRERYQLKAMEWIISQPQFVQGEGMPNLLGLSEDEISGAAGNDVLDERGMEDAVQGLSGLIVLGAAWESVDVTFALGLALRLNGEEENAYVALLRCKELIDAGHTSFVKGAPLGRSLVAELGRMLPSLEDDKRSLVEENFTNQRKEAEQWRDKRNDAILDLLNKGMHPDTHKSFWAKVDGATEPKPVATVSQAPADGLARNWLWVALGGAVILAIGGAGFTVYRRRTTPEPAKPPREDKLPMPGKD